MSKITIIDAPCGQGKTTWAINEMNEHPDQAYIYCTPFLDEINRIIRSTRGKHDFYQPQLYETTKIEDFNRLLCEQRDIAVSHSTFLNATPETLDYIRQGEYALFVDEALEVVSDFNKIHAVEKDAKQKTSPKDIQMLCDGGFIQIRQDGLVQWIKGSYEGGKFELLERMSKLNRAYWVRGKLMLCLFPQEIFREFNKIYIMTYIFEGSSLCPYFDMFGIEYEKVSVTKKDGLPTLCEYTQDSDAEFRSRCSELITVCKNAKMNNYSRGTLSKTWYEKATAEDFKKLRNNIQNFFKNQAHAKASHLVSSVDENGNNILQTEIMWTCYSDYENILKGAGYTSARRLSKADEESMSKEERERLKCFVPCNARASNKYKTRWALAYCVNMYYNTMMNALFIDKGFGVNEDKYAVANLIQWVFRSRVRDGEPIHLYLPSKRMRDLYYKWLDGKL